MIRRLLCKIIGHRWRRRYFENSIEGPEFICHRCGHLQFACHQPPKPWPRPAPGTNPPPPHERPVLPKTSVPPRITGRAPARPDRAPVAEWLDPLVYPPPKGTKLQLLTDWGIAVYGHWEDVGYIAWAPLLQKPSWLLQRMRESRLKKAADYEQEVKATGTDRDVPKRRASD